MTKRGCVRAVSVVVSERCLLLLCVARVNKRAAKPALSVAPINRRVILGQTAQCCDQRPTPHSAGQLTSNISTFL